MNSQSSSWVQFFASFTKQIDGTTTDDFEDLDLLLPMYHSLEYNSNFSDTTGSSWFYSKDLADNFSSNFANTDNFKSSKRKTK